MRSTCSACGTHDSRRRFTHVRVRKIRDPRRKGRWFHIRWCDLCVTAGYLFGGDPVYGGGHEASLRSVQDAAHRLAKNGRDDRLRRR